MMGAMYRVLDDDDSALVEPSPVSVLLFDVQLTPVARTPSWSYRTSLTVASTIVALQLKHQV
jgi:hypothetical protein